MELKEQIQTQLKSLIKEFTELEAKYNTYNLDQLKDLYSSIVLDEARLLQTKLDNLVKEFNENGEVIFPDEDSYIEIDHALHSVRMATDTFLEDLETIDEALKSIGDLDKGSITWKNLRIDLS